MKYSLIKYDDDKYPQTLRNITNPPKQLYAVGNNDLLFENSIAVIGSRNCTEYGKRITEEITKKLASKGICIVSGMAKGIDAIAHISAINVRGKTIAVLGGGFNNIYPKENEGLFEEIIQNNGLVISEYKPSSKPEGWKFPERNRIVSGLSLGVLVIEAAYRSGTSITAALAQKQKRKVMCIPSSLENNKGVGTNKLIKNGAILVTSADDIIKEFKEFDNLKLNNDNIELTNERKISENYEKIYKDVYKLTSDIPISLNEIAKKTGKPIQEIEYIITILELDDFIEVIQNKGVRRKHCI